MKITTDACLFGAIIPVENATRILDIGTGTGLLSLMAAQRSSAKIDALEIEPGALAQAADNFSLSPWSARLNLHEKPAQDFSSNSEEKYDCILCNPPFFTGSTRCPDAQRNMARHDDSLPLSALFQALKNNLDESNGGAWLLLPSDSDSDACSEAENAGLHLCQRIEVASSTEHQPHRSILAFRHRPAPLKQQRINIYSRHPEYSEAATEILSPYYLKL
ncbi:tRNA1(Val) (adenine(37)-N6)-methyltransferase [Endozoicomonadaceae bacterium StTr2]